MKVNLKLEIKYSLEDRGYICRSVEYPAISTYGRSPEKAIKAMRRVLEILKLRGVQQPLPKNDEEKMQRRYEAWVWECWLLVFTNV